VKAAVVAEGGGFRVTELPRPEVGSNDVLVRVRAASLNHADLHVLAGRMHGSTGGPGTVLGMEWAGEVIAVGADVRTCAPGDRVMGSGRGALAQEVLADAGRVLPLPGDALGWEEAAALPVALQTMHDAIVTNGHCRKGQSVLIQGASSSVGLMGLRIARALGAAVVIGSSRNEGTRAALHSFGADAAVDSTAPGWPEQVRALTGGRGVDLVVDMLSGDTANGNLTATAVGGRIVNVGRLAGRSANFDFDLHALRRITYVGVTFRTRTPSEVAEVVRRMRADLWPLVLSGTLSMPVAQRFGFDELDAAFRQLREGGHLGKLVVSLP
jgi:NADPH2:quinone reductase